MKILVTGGAGYLGSVLLPKLLARGHQIRVVDIGYFGLGHLRGLDPAAEVIREDLRTLVADHNSLSRMLSGIECIIHLAAISNDPSAELNPELTHDVNLHVTEVLAKAAKTAKIRFVFSSSCSVYGDADSEVDESGKQKPLTTYAVTKMKAEQALFAMADRNWSPVVLRNGTLFGFSPRMRFDLVANIFSLYSTLHNEIKVFGDGLHWRPFLHVGDAARALLYFAECEHPAHNCYNIAHENLRVVDLADIFKKINPRLKVIQVKTEDQDQRNYRVSTARMVQDGFNTRMSVISGSEEMVEAIISGAIPDPESIYYRNAKWLKELSLLGSKDHREMMNVIETMAHIRSGSKG
ncbi:MAG TPA: SDR family oxidoreductase [Acidobacteriota bacterium]|nr:SDR family oxidoreductase [Acidobacteriota bacterium]